MLTPRQNLMLAALSGAGEHATYTPVQVQKLFFLIDREAAAYVNGPHFDFKPYDYGPFDRAVYDELEYLTRIGLTETVQGIRTRLYMLTSEGYAIGVNELTRFPTNIQDFIKRCAIWVRSLSFQQLVAAIYNKYEDMRVNSVFRE